MDAKGPRSIVRLQIIECLRKRKDVSGVCDKQRLLFYCSDPPSCLVGLQGAIPLFSDKNVGGVSVASSLAIQHFPPRRRLSALNKPLEIAHYDAETPSRAFPALFTQSPESFR